MIRLDRLQRALREALSGVAPAFWTMQQVPHKSAGATMLALSLTAGPSIQHRTHYYGRFDYLAETATVRVAAANEATRLIVRINGFDHYYDVEAGDTVTDARDALLTSIVDHEELYPISAAATGTDGITLTSEETGAIYELQVS